MTKTSRYKDADKSHFGKAFAEAVGLDADELRIVDAVYPGRKVTLTKSIREKNGILEKLTAKDRKLTQALSVYLKQHGEIENVAEFLDWGKKQDLLGAMELPTLRAQLRAHFGFYSARGWKPRKT